MSSIETETKSPSSARFAPRTDIVSILRRRVKVAAITFILVFGAALAALILITPRYLASGTIIVAEPTTAIDAGSPAGADKVGDPADLESQIIVLKSTNIVRRALEKPEVLAAAVEECHLNARGALSMLAGAPKCGEPGQDPTLLVDQMQQRFSIGAVGRSRVLSVSLDSTSPTTAQVLVNGLIDAFLADRSQQFALSKQKAVTTLQRDLDALDVDLRSDEEKIRDFRSKNQLVRGTTAPISTEKLSSLSQSLIQAEAAKAAAYARLQEIEKARKGDLINNPTIAGSRTIGDLKQQLVLLDLQIAHDAAHLGPRHPTMVSLGEMRDALNARIRTEMDSIVATTKAAYDSASTLVTQLRSKMNAAATEADSDLDQESSIADQVRAADAKRARYAELQRQLTEVTSRKPPFADSTRLVSRAEVPSVPYFPKRLPFVAGGFVVALMLAAFAAVATDRFDRRLRAPAAISSQSGLPVLAELPRVALPMSRSLRRRALPPVADLTQSLRLCWDNAEYRRALDDLAASFLARIVPGTALKVALVSTAPGDGRTHTAIALGEILAENGKRVLILEGDLRKPSIGRALALPEVPGLSDILQKQSSFEGEVHRFGPRDLFVLCAGTPVISGASAFMGPHMADVMRFADTFDVVLIDTPPFHLSKDAAALARLAGEAIICSRWGASEADALQSMIDQLAAAGSRPAGVVATMVDLEALPLYERRPRPAKVARARRPLLKAAT